MTKITIIGGGNMGEAIIGSIYKKFSVQVCEKDKARQDHLKRAYKVKIEELPKAITTSDVVIVAVKPQDIEEVLKNAAPHWKPQTLVISIAAGITTAFLEKVLSTKAIVVRTMPNMPATIGEGITAVCGGQNAKPADIQLARKIFDNLGKTVIVEENMMDAITAVSGSGPAYVFLFIESLTKAAQGLGLDEKMAYELVITTFAGSLKLLEKSKETPAALRDKVTSKGGTTQAALDVFLKNNFDYIVAQALEAAKKRAAELTKS